MSGTFIQDAVGTQPQDALLHMESEKETTQRLLIMVVIFVVSLTAVSFPTVTATFRTVRVPSIVFFIGKHFGTGVILSTAFVHLLQDSFKALQKPIVNERWRIGDFTGLIVLISLLIIFLVEYISTAFVERLQSYPSAPSTPTESVAPSPAESIQMEFEGSLPSRPAILVQSPQNSSAAWIDGLPATNTDLPAIAAHPLSPPSPVTETTPQPPSPHRSHSRSLPHSRSHSPTLTSERAPLHAETPDQRNLNYGATLPRSAGAPRTRQSDKHAHTHTHDAVSDSFFSGGHHRHEPRGAHASHHARVSRWRFLGISFPWYNGSGAAVVATQESGALIVGADVDAELERAHDGAHVPTHAKDTPPARQPSLRAHSRGHAHARSGSRKGASPSPHSHHSHGHGHGHEHGHGHGHGHGHLDMERWMTNMDGDNVAPRHVHVHAPDEEYGLEEGVDEVTKVGRRRQVIGILVLQLGIMIHSLVIGLTLSISRGSEFTSLVIAIVFHQLFEGLSLGIRIAGLPSSHHEHGMHHFPGHTLKPLLAFTFATTTPFGIGLGLLTLHGHTRGPHLILAQGVMSAISAGMLIYAACVEMLAGDFVMDAHLWRSSVRRQVLALVSLFMGVFAMAAIGLD
ncbi:hypothetical protein V8D89_006209 [Ganoderma adspersum]